jgi:hypothetical protein
MVIGLGTMVVGLGTMVFGITSARTTKRGTTNRRGATKRGGTTKRKATLSDVGNVDSEVLQVDKVGVGDSLEVIQLVTMLVGTTQATLSNVGDIDFGVLDVDKVRVVVAFQSLTIGW